MPLYNRSNPSSFASKASKVCDWCRPHLPLFPAGLDISSSQHQHNLDLRYIDGLCSAALYRWPINHWIHALKFGAKPQYAQSLAYFLAKQLEQQDWQIDHTASIPLSTFRKLSRGFNQVDLILEDLYLYIHPRSKVINTASKYRDLIRHRHTKPQAKLTQQQRVDNVKRVFKCLTPLIGKSVLLIDDVVTTANTVNQAARALKNAGATKVYVGCAALKVLD